MNSHLLPHRMPQAAGDAAVLKVGYCLHP